MASFGVGVYVLAIIWFITLMLCWVSVRTGHYIGKIAVVVSFIITIVLVVLPKGEVQGASGANFYDKYFVPRIATVLLLLLSLAVGSIYLFIYVCLTPVETRKIKHFGTNN